MPRSVSAASEAEQPYQRTPENSRYAMFGGIYMLIKTVGEGEFGKVKLAVNVNTSKQVAVKLTKKSLLGPERRERLMREISILQSLDHPYILKMYEVIETESYIGMIMEPCLGGELFEYIVRRNNLQEPDAVRFFAQIITGVSYLHSVGIVHRDLKLENILLDSDQNIVIADFGFASQAIRNDSEMLETSCGSPAYAAPELVLSDKYSGVAADIWSCGVIMYSMLAGYLPYDDDPENPDGANIHLLYKYIMNSKPQYPDFFSEDAKDLIGIMLVTDPTQRAKMTDIMGHQWLAPAVAIFEDELVRRKKLLGITEAAVVPSGVVTDSSDVTATDSMQIEPSEVVEILDQGKDQPPAIIIETEDDIVMTEATQQMVNDKESVLDLPRSSTETPVSFSVKFATEHEVIQSPTPPPESIVTETVTVPNPVVLTPVPQSPLPHISKSVEQLAAGSRLEWLFKRTTPLTRANSDSRRSRTSRSNNGTSEASIGASSARVLPSLAFSFSARSKSNSSQQRDPALALSGSTRSFTNNTLSMTNSGRQSTTVSISASDYHLRYNKSPPKRRVRTYFRGPIDKRAVSGRDLEALFSDLELALLDQGMEVVDSGVKTGEYKFTVTQPGMVVCGTPLPGVKLRGVPVDLKMLAKKGGEFAVLEKTILEDKVSVVRLESGMSKALEREVKSREHVSGPGGGGFPIWVSKKVQYLQSYGINYNKGYDGKAAGGISGFKKVMAAVPPLPSVEDGASAASSSDKPATVVRFVDEIIFYVEVFRLKELKDMYVVEFKRKSGDIWEFKELYQRLIAELPLTKEY